MPAERPDPAPTAPARPAPPAARADRLKAALRANLARRKAQLPGRAGEAEPEPREPADD